MAALMTPTLLSYFHEKLAIISVVGESWIVTSGREVKFPKFHVSSACEVGTNGTFEMGILGK